jgi:nitrogen-specific signal transduction histidine kinase
MEKFFELREKAKKELKNAEQALNFTYPLVGDNRILLNVVNHLFLASTNIMGCLLYFELIHKRLSEFTDNFESKFHLMKSSMMDRYNLDLDYLCLVRDLKDIIIAHNESPIEFSRGKKLVICSDNYNLKQITPENLKNAAAKTKLFIDEVIHITDKKPYFAFICII